MSTFRITPIGNPPTPRAAHVATAVGTMVVIQVSRKYHFVCLCGVLYGFHLSFEFILLTVAGLPLLICDRVVLVLLGCLPKIYMSST